MNLRKVVAIVAAMMMLAGSVLNVSAAEKISSSYVKALKKSGAEKLIIDVEAYKAAYSDLEAAFGDNVDAYIEHYLTVGIYEGRTKGVLFDPLAYAEAYGDVKDAFGDNISAIVDHYVKYGVAENRTVGTANGYTDLETAEKNGAGVPIQIRANVYVNSIAGNSSVSEEAAERYVAVIASSVTNNTGYSAGAISNYVSSAASGSSAASSDGNKVVLPPLDYNRTTSIYGGEDGKTLIRVEYYDENNKLSHYSDVTNYDPETKSYTEEIYHYDEEKNEEVLDRTNTYVDGNLSSSE